MAEYFRPDCTTLSGPFCGGSSSSGTEGTRTRLRTGSDSRPVELGGDLKRFVWVVRAAHRIHSLATYESFGPGGVMSDIGSLYLAKLSPGVCTA